MQITNTNYESYMIDLLEGNLSADLEMEMHRFLAAHPDKMEEYQTLQSLNILPIAEDSKEKMNFDFLKKDEQGISSDDEMIAALEGDLTADQQMAFEKKLTVYPELNKEYALFQKTKLSKPVLVFEHKESLKKKEAKIIPLLYRYVAVAAVFAAIGVGVFIYFGLNQNTEMTAYQLPVQNEKIEPQKLTQRTQISGYSKPTIHSSVQTKTKLPETQELNLVAKEEVQMITGKTGELPASEGGLGYINPIEIENQNNQPAQLAQSAGEDKFLAPGEWLWNKMKEQIPGKTLAYKDSIQENGAGMVALNLLQRSTGITYEEKKNPEAGVRSIAIVSKYFAYERIIHP